MLVYCVLGASICVSNGVGRRGNLSSVLFRHVPLVVLSRNNVRVIGDLIQSW